MADIQPFCGLRPRAGMAAEMISLPYDVMDRAEARMTIQTQPNSFLRVTRPDALLPDEADPHGPEAYRTARQEMEGLLKKRLLVEDAEPSFYVYRQVMGDHVQVGLVAAASLDEYDREDIRKHELTRPDKEKDRVEHIRWVEAQTGPVFLTYRAEEKVRRLMDQAMEGNSVMDVICSDGIRHTLYQVAEAGQVAEMQTAFKKIHPLYIADGHHRSAAASAVRKFMEQKASGRQAAEAGQRFLAVLFPHDMMRIMDYNRVVRDLNGMTAAEFLSRVEAAFHCRLAGKNACRPKEPRTFGLYLEGVWYELRAREGTFDPADILGRLDVNILQDQVLAPLLGIHDPRRDQRIGFVGGIRGMAELERLVDEGGFQAAFSLYPTSMEELMDIADAGKIMPPKSTWFEPKLRDAVVVYRTPGVGGGERE